MKRTTIDRAAPGHTPALPPALSTNVRISIEDVGLPNGPRLVYGMKRTMRRRTWLRTSLEA